MNIIVLGAGAIGLCFGGLLAKNGHRVILLGRRQIVEPINNRGLTIEGIWGNHSVTIKCYSTLPELKEMETAPFDVALLTVKAYDTTKMLDQVKETFPAPFPVVSLQNGLGNVEEIVRLIGRGRAIGGSVMFGAEVPEPGKVRVTVYAREVRIGGVDGGIPWDTVEEIAGSFSKAGIPTLATKEITRYQWGSVLYHCSLNGLGAILGVKCGPLLEHESTRMLITDIVKEVFQVLRKERIRVEWTNAEAYLQELFVRLCPLTCELYSSMLQDIQNGKKTEIDALNGAIVRLAHDHGFDVPVNWLITKLVKVKEKISAGLKDGKELTAVQG